MIMYAIGIILSGMVTTLWALVFTSFMVGMIKDVGLGWKILGYGVAAYVGFGIVLVLVFVVISGFI